MKKQGMLALSLALAWVLAGCDETKDEEKQGRNVCEKAGLLAFGAAKRYCDTNKDCKACEDFLHNADISKFRPEEGALECQGRELSAANACQDDPTRCEECVVMLVNAQCEERMPSLGEGLGCRHLIEFLPPM